MKIEMSVAKALALAGGVSLMTGLLLNGVQLKEYFLPAEPNNPALAKMRAIHCTPEIVSSNGNMPYEPAVLFNPANPECITGKAGKAVEVTFKVCGSRPLTMFTSGVGTYTSGDKGSTTTVSYSLDGFVFTDPVLVRGEQSFAGKVNTANLPRRYVRYVTGPVDPAASVSVCSLRVEPLNWLQPLTKD